MGGRWDGVMCCGVGRFGVGWGGVVRCGVGWGGVGRGVAWRGVCCLQGGADGYGRGPEGGLLGHGFYPPTSSCDLGLRVQGLVGLLGFGV